MTRAVTIGYASMDYPAVLDGYFNGEATTLIKHRPADSFPRPGGCPLYAAGPRAAHGIPVSVITWVGDDELGALYRASAVEQGIDPTGIGVVADGATPICFLIYQADGSCGCCFDPGFLGRETLTEAQAALIGQAGLVAFTVGPPDIGMQALDLVSDTARVAWVAKNDPRSYPDALCAALGARADYIFCNVHERAGVDRALAAAGASRTPLIVETDGAAPVKVDRAGKVERVAVSELTFHDAVGAGDTLAGGCLAAVAAGQTDPDRIAAAGIDAAGRLLEGRAIDD